MESFRPLDGESFSKPYPCKACELQGLRGGFRAKNLTSTFWCQNPVQTSSKPLKSTISSHRGKTQIASFTFESITQKNSFIFTNTIKKTRYSYCLAFSDIHHLQLHHYSQFLYSTTLPIVQRYTFSTTSLGTQAFTAMPSPRYSSLKSSPYFRIS